MLRLLAVACLIACVSAIPIDNGVNGDAEIECGPTSISVNFNTQRPFSGHVYVKGLFADTANGCRTDGDNSRAIGQITLPFDKCNVQRVRSLDPKGIFVRTTVVISFHPNFMTKIDRAYTIQCFYMEADKTVSTGIEVSMITTGFQTQLVPMPVCRYEILDSPTGQPVAFAIIGQPVFHKWTCDTDTVDTFCMTVHSCFVDDGAGDRLDLIDEQGCALDRYLMGNLEYPTDLMGVKEVHVFKYADRPALQFQCQITILIKEPNAQCIRPQCAEPGGRGDGSAGGALPSSSSAGARPATGTPASQPSAGGQQQGGQQQGSQQQGSQQQGGQQQGGQQQGGQQTTAAAGGAAAVTQASTQGGNNTFDARSAFFIRKRRSVEEEPTAVGTMDVATPRISAVDIEDSEVKLPSSLLNSRHLYQPITIGSQQDGFCLSTATASILLVLILIIVVAIVVATTYMFTRSRKM